MGRRLTTEIFIERARKVHGDKYSYSDVEYKNNSTKVLIHCNCCGNDFLQRPDHHMLNHGCPICNGGVRSNRQDFIVRAKKVHGDRYDYCRVDYMNNKTKVEIVCPEHGSFWQKPNDHLRGYGCPRCYGNKRFTESDFVCQAKKIHGTKYDYSNVEYVNNKTKVCIICPKHGEFWQRPNDHLKGSGCPKCGDALSSKIRMKSLDDFIYDVEKIHGDKYDYLKVNYKGNKIPVLIKCNSCGNEFWQIPDAHLRGEGCPKCAHLDSSYEEYLFNELLSIYDDKDIEREYNKDERYPFNCDFYIKSQDLFIELNGFWTHNDHWFDKNDKVDVEQLGEWESRSGDSYVTAIHTWTVRDVLKRAYARKNNLNYVVFWGDESKDQIREWIAEGCPIRKDWK